MWTNIPLLPLFLKQVWDNQIFVRIGPILYPFARFIYMILQNYFYFF